MRKWNVSSRIWAWITLPPAFLSIILGISLLDRDQRQTLQIVTSCMLGIVPVILFHIYRRDVIERSQMEQALRESEERYRQLVELSPNAIAVERDGHVVYANRAAVQLLGVNSAADLVGRRVMDLVHPSHRPALEERLQRVHIAQQMEPMREEQFLRRDGGVVDVELTAIPFTHRGLPSIQIVLRDVTQRKRAEYALRKSTQDYEALVNSIEGIVWEADAQTITFTYVSKQSAKILGYQAERWLATPAFWQDHLHPDDRDRVLSYYHQSVSQRRSRALEYRMIAADDSVVWLRDIVTVLVEHYQPTKLRGIMVAITEQKRAEEEMRRSNERFELVARATNDVVWDRDLQTNSVWWNNGVEKVFGYSHDQVAADADWWFERIHPDDHDRITSAAKKLVATKGHTWTDEYRFRRADGSYAFVLDRCYVIHDHNGTPVRMIGAMMDITQRKEAEEALRVTEERWQLVLKGNSDGIFDWDARTDKTFHSARWKEMIGYAEHELGDEPVDWETRVHPEDFTRVKQALQDHFDRKTPFYVAEYRLRCKDGSYKWILARGQAVWDANGKPVRMVGSHTDVTPQKRAQEQLAAYSEELRVKNEELAAALRAARDAGEMKSQFLANMSHELRTPMNGVIGLTGLLLDTPLTPEQRQLAEVVRGSAESLLGIINDILDFSKIEAGKLDLEEIDFEVRAASEDVVELLAEQAERKGLELYCQVDRDVPELVGGDPGRLRQVLTNLVSNAVKFTERGEIGVTARLVEKSDKGVKLMFEVRDTGIGMSVDAQRRLFEPFRQADGSTTRRYGGTGLGLAISKQLVEMMGGQIGVSSERGIGSRFWFTVQLKTAVAQPPDPVLTQFRSRRLLVVDDHAGTRQALARLAEDWGMTAGQAENTAQAMQLLLASQEQGTPFDFALIDSQLPGVTGDQFAGQIRNHPAVEGVKVVLLCPFSHLAQCGRQTSDRVAAFLTKPVRQAQLMRVLARLIGLPDSANDKPGKLWSELPAPPSAAERRVLVAEDNPVNQKVAAHMLRKLGYRPDVVASGLEVLEALSRVQYAVVLMDCQMPEMDGFEATEEIRRREAGARHTPIIAMTASAMQGDRQKCLSAGMDDYIAKPVRPAEMATALERWVKQGALAAPEDSQTLKNLADNVGGDRQPATRAEH
jgi:PAS domain S-box-containing protein